MFRLYKINGRLTKISDNNNSLRSNEILGVFFAPPTVNYSFTIYAAPLDCSKDYREVSTSKITAVSTEGEKIIFKTMNSYYMLEVF